MSISRVDVDHTLTELTTRQRATLVAGSCLPVERIMSITDAQIDFRFLQENSIRASNLVVARITPASLKQRGVTTAHEMRTLDFDAMHLLDAAFCSSAIAAYGAEEIIKSFLVSPSDAVTLAGSCAITQLGLDVGTLLAVCAGSPVQAHAVLEQTMPRGAALTGVAPVTLLDTGLRSNKLKELGYSARAVQEQTRATSSHLSKLGF